MGRVPPLPTGRFSIPRRRRGADAELGRKTNVGQVGNLRGGWLPPPVPREVGRGRFPIGRRLPTCPTKSRPPTDARSVFHGISRAEGPFKRTTQAMVCPTWWLLRTYNRCKPKGLRLRIYRQEEMTMKRGILGKFL